MECRMISKEGGGIQADEEEQRTFRKSSGRAWETR